MTCMRMMLVTLLVLFLATPGPGNRYAFRYAVDGDTIDVAGIGRVRLLGIDAPEMGAGRTRRHRSHVRRATISRHCS